MNHLDEYVFPFMNSREIERLEIEQKVLNYYHYGSQILCGQFIESTSANWPSNTQKKIKMTQWNLYILDFTQKKKNLISNYNQMYDDLHMPMLTREMLMELHEQFNFTLKLLVT